MQLHTTNASAASPAKAVVSEAVGERLKSLYDSVASEPVPDRFADLLSQLADADQDNDETDDNS